jgi:hypothetical protein
MHSKNIYAAFGNETLIGGMAKFSSSGFLPSILAILFSLLALAAHL